MGSFHATRERGSLKFQDDTGEWQNINNFEKINHLNQTDIEISERLFEMENTFVNSAIGNVSKIYISITITTADGFGGRFKKKFLKTYNSYDFSQWEEKKNVVGEEQNFDQLCKDF